MPILDDIKKKLEGSDLKDDLLKLIGDLSAEVSDQSGRESSQKANKEAENVRNRYKKKWDMFGLDPNSDNFEADVVNYLDEVKKVKESGKGATENENSEIKLLTAQLNNLSTELKTSQETALKEKRSRRTSGLEKNIMAELVAGKAHSPDIVLPAIMRDINQSSIDAEKFNPHFLKNDVEIDLKTGVASFLQDNPSQVKNETAPGGDSGSQTGGERQAPNSDDMQSRRNSFRERQTARTTV